MVCLLLYVGFCCYLRRSVTQYRTSFNIFMAFDTVSYKCIYQIWIAPPPYLFHLKFMSILKNSLDIYRSKVLAKLVYVAIFGDSLKLIHFVC